MHDTKSINHQELEYPFLSSKQRGKMFQIHGPFLSSSFSFSFSRGLLHFLGLMQPKLLSQRLSRSIHRLSNIFLTRRGKCHSEE